MRREFSPIWYCCEHGFNWISYILTCCVSLLSKHCFLIFPFSFFGIKEFILYILSSINAFSFWFWSWLHEHMELRVSSWCRLVDMVCGLGAWMDMWSFLQDSLSIINPWLPWGLLHCLFCWMTFYFHKAGWNQSPDLSLSCSAMVINFFCFLNNSKLSTLTQLVLMICLSNSWIGFPLARDLIPPLPLWHKHLP